MHPDNPRYFTDGTRRPDGTLKAVYLTGAHTWNNLVDMGPSDPPEAFPRGSLKKYLTRSKADEELVLLRGCSLEAPE